MKRILIVILLLVFSAQGIAVAVGENVTNAKTSISLEKPLAEITSNTDYTNIDESVVDDSTVSSDIEEMSDYVAIAVANDKNADGAILPLADNYPFISTNLPKALPPPRS